jgi:hypothetical protein
MDVLLVDLSLALLALGLVSIVRPLRVLGVRSRRSAARVALAGAALAATGLLLPVTPARLSGGPMAIDEIVPAYQFGERHEIAIHAPPERVMEAVRSVTAREIHLFRLLTWLRSPHLGNARESILNPSPDEPILDVALRSGFLLLREVPEREVVFGAVVCCGRRTPPKDVEEWAALSGSLARAVMNFNVTEAGSGRSRLVTETRVAASDAGSERRFAVYWRLIYPGSALIRRTWLRAIKARAERPLRP